MIVKCTNQIAVSILLLFAIFMDVNAQTFNCPSDFNENDWIENNNEFKVKFEYSPHYHIQKLNSDAYISSHRIQGSGTNLTVLIDWSTFVNNLKPLSDEAAKDLMIMRLANYYNDLYGSPCITYNQDVFTIKFVSQAQCSVTTSCLSELHYEDQILCDNNHNLSARTIPFNGKVYWRQFRTKPCGMKCCLTILKLKCKQAHDGTLTPSFLPKEYVSISNCPPPSIIECPIPNQNPPPNLLPCVGDCQKGELK